MDHDLELIRPILEIFGNLIFIFSHILEILEIEVFNILSNPGNTGHRFFLFSHILEVRAAGGLPWIIFGTCSWKNEHGNLGSKVKTNTFLKMASQAKPPCS